MAEISKITIPVDGTPTTYDIKDAVARAAIAGGVQFLGITTTEITDGSSAASISINGESHTSTNGDMVFYGSKEFIFSSGDSKWHEFGDLGSLGTLATKNSASGSFTPKGTVSQPTANPSVSNTTVNSITAVGTLPTYTVSGEVLTLTAGTLPTKGANVSVIQSIDSITISQPTFTGTADTVTVS